MRREILRTKRRERLKPQLQHKRYVRSHWVTSYSIIFADSVGNRDRSDDKHDGFQTSRPPKYCSQTSAKETHQNALRFIGKRQEGSSTFVSSFFHYYSPRKAWGGGLGAGTDEGADGLGDLGALFSGVSVFLWRYKSRSDDTSCLRNEKLDWQL
ncbi:hypothetical protein VTO42DRAFT_1692 [Malbranchea cinnamomea]